MNINSNFRLLATFARSFDKYHTSKQLIHLVSSIYFTEYLSFESLYEKLLADIRANPNSNTKIIIRVLSDNIDDLGMIVTPNGKLILIELPLTNLLGLVNKNIDKAIIESLKPNKSVVDVSDTAPSLQCSSLPQDSDKSCKGNTESKDANLENDPNAVWVGIAPKLIPFLIGAENFKDNSKMTKNILNNTLFVFEDID
jgi:hypothetical protein